MKVLGAVLAAVTLVSSVAVCSPALAWGAAGHQLIGAIADQLLNKNAKSHVDALLGPGITLQLAGPYLDCVRSVQMENGAPVYDPDPKHPEYRVPCKVFETPAWERRMQDYAGANWTACGGATPGNPCHALYHFADIPFEDGQYGESSKGARNYDIVHAIDAAIAKLRGDPVPAPFVIVDDTDALLMLAHLIGDLHQPLHVGAVYLEPDGTVVDPDAQGGPSPDATTTHGGNWILDPADKSDNLHREWDDVSEQLGATPDQTLMQTARAEGPPQGAVYTKWAGIWASDTVVAAKPALSPLGYRFSSSNRWLFNAPASYSGDRDGAQQTRMAKAGARLALLLNAIWPDAP